MTHPIMSKVPQYPRPHDFNGSFGAGVESAVNDYATVVPIITYDEGLGVINSYKSNPANANFAEYAGAKCYPTSRVNKIFAEFTVSLSKEAIETDKVPILKFKSATYHTAFNEGAQALDEKSTLDLNEIMEMQVETTDRQSFPLYNAIDMKDGKSNGRLDLEVGQEGLDTDLEIEGIAFLEDDYYDCLHYYTNGPKLRSLMTPLRTYTLTKNHPSTKIYVQQQSNTKYLNPYTFLGQMFYFPASSWRDQYGKVGDTTDLMHFQIDWVYRYNEFNFEFNHSLQ